jgi:hypothetical protein
LQSHKLYDNIYNITITIIYIKGGNMATIVNTPAQSDNGNGMLLAVILLILFVIGAIFFGLPLLRNLTQSQTPQINVPNQIDVNVKGVPNK